MYNNARMPTELLPVYEVPPPWIPQQHRTGNPAYDNDLRKFLPRKICLRRNHISDTLGFNVRGGEDHKCGMYIAWVKPDSEADRLGLREADQIVEVNGVSFENIEHAQAVSILKGSLDVYMTLRYFPYGYKRTHRGD